MRHNVGRLDRWVRALVLGPLAVVLLVRTGGGSALGLVAAAAAALLFTTAVTGACPVYAVLDLSTRGGRGVLHR